jgi:hypothetical protein
MKAFPVAILMLVISFMDNPVYSMPIDHGDFQKLTQHDPPLQPSTTLPQYMMELYQCWQKYDNDDTIDQSINCKTINERHQEQRNNTNTITGFIGQQGR